MASRSGDSQQHEHVKPRYRVFWDADNVAFRDVHFKAIERDMAPRRNFSLEVFANRPTARALIEPPEEQDWRPFGAKTAHPHLLVACGLCRSYA